mmetsp:Transcript_15989/g.29934  ORF Transcript_15989/g.29934 Transcript_15989/m.29934 type:complete len:533 (+) Transcript_15989:36-1634(+)
MRHVALLPWLWCCVSSPLSRVCIFCRCCLRLVLAVKREALKSLFFFFSFAKPPLFLTPTTTPFSTIYRSFHPPPFPYLISLPNKLPPPVGLLVPSPSGRLLLRVPSPTLLLLLLQHLADAVELLLQPLVSGALVLEVVDLPLEDPLALVEVEDVGHVPLVDPLELGPEVALELLHKREEVEAVELRADALPEALPPLGDDVLDEAADDEVGPVGVAGAGRLLHQLEEVVVVPLPLVGVRRDLPVPVFRRLDEGPFADVRRPFVLGGGSLVRLLRLLVGSHGDLVDAHDVPLVGEGAAEGPAAPLVEVPGDVAGEGGEVVAAPAHATLRALLDEVLEDGLDEFPELGVGDYLRPVVPPLVLALPLHLLPQHVLRYGEQVVHNMVGPQFQAVQERVEARPRFLHRDDARGPQKVNPVVGVPNTGGVRDFVFGDGRQPQAFCRETELPQRPVILTSAIKPMIPIPNVANDEPLPPPLADSHRAPIMEAPSLEVLLRQRLPEGPGRRHDAPVDSLFEARAETVAESVRPSLEAFDA